MVVNVDTIESIAEWFCRAVPKPTAANLLVQAGCHLEEVSEFASAIGNQWLAQHLEECAHELKVEKPEMSVDPVLTLDALCDQIVTAIGLAHMAGWDIISALAEVDRANWSKFVDGAPVFDANGKIQKGPAYIPPALEGFV